MEASHPPNAPRGSCRFCLNESKASISGPPAARVKLAVRMAQSATARSVRVAVDIGEIEEGIEVKFEECGLAADVTPYAEAAASDSERKRDGFWVYLFMRCFAVSLC